GEGACAAGAVQNGTRKPEPLTCAAPRISAAPSLTLPRKRGRGKVQWLRPPTTIPILGDSSERGGEALPRRLVSRQAEAQPCRPRGEAAHRDAGAAEVIEQRLRGLGPHQREQRCPADDLEFRLAQHMVEPGRLAGELITRGPRPGAIRQRARSGDE